MDVYVPALDGEEEGMVIIKDGSLRLGSGVLAQIHYIDLPTTAVRKFSIRPFRIACSSHKIKHK